MLEGGFSNLWWVNNENHLITHPCDNRILGGITRRRLLDVAAKNGYLFREEEYTLKELLGAQEVFLTNSSTFIASVVQVDDKPIAGGTPGALVKQLRQEYINFVTELGN